MKILLFGLLFAWTLPAQMMQAVVGATHVSAGCSSPFTDTFSGGNQSPIAGNWTNNVGTINLTSNIATIPSTGNEAQAYVNCFTFSANQFAQATIGTTTKYAGPAVRISPSANTHYRCVSDGGTNLVIYKYTAGTQDTIDSAVYTVATNDVIKLTVTGTSSATLQCFVNGSSKIGPTGDPGGAITTGQPGIAGWNTGQITAVTASN